MTSFQKAFLAHLSREIEGIKTPKGIMQERLTLFAAVDWANSCLERSIVIMWWKELSHHEQLQFSVEERPDWLETDASS